MTMLPRSGRSNPAIMLISEVLPAPRPEQPGDPALAGERGLDREFAKLS